MSFNIRVYGILINRKNEVLVSDEVIRGKLYTKFPGGGLEYGEGTRDCLRREFKEELNLDIKVGDHIYTTDFFQESAFKEKDQLVAVYYFAAPMEKIREFKTHFDTPEEITKGNPHASSESFRFVSMRDFSEDLLSFPVDKVVAKMIREQQLHQ